ncbi:hypothetical protein AAE478_000056 [Parahypoxylon ruwenzoriense]
MDGKELSVFNPDELEPTAAALNNKMKQIADKRQKGCSARKVTSWALYHKAEFERLITSIVTLIDNLEKLFPLPSRKTLIQEEIDQIGDEESIRLLKKSYKALDGMVTAGKKTLDGHIFGKIEVEGTAQAGDAFSDNWQGSVHGLSHRYEDIRVGKRGKAIFGNKYGGKDIFD